MHCYILGGLSTCRSTRLLSISSTEFTKVYCSINHNYQWVDYLLVLVRLNVLSRLLIDATPSETSSVKVVFSQVTCMFMLLFLKRSIRSSLWTNAHHNVTVLKSPRWRVLDCGKGASCVIAHALRVSLAMRFQTLMLLNIKQKQNFQKKSRCAALI